MWKSESVDKENKAMPPTGTLPGTPSKRGGVEAACLERFTVSLLRFTLRAIDAVELPRFSGSTFRGAFGAEFRRLVCIPPCQDAETCVIASRCAYARVFEGRPDKEGYSASGNGGLPRPFVIHPPSNVESVIRPGELFVFHMALIGWASEYVPYFILTWRELGPMGLGRGRGRFKLEKVESCVSLDLDPPAQQVGQPMNSPRQSNHVGQDAVTPLASASTRLIYCSDDELVRNALQPLTAERLISNRSLECGDSSPLFSPPADDDSPNPISPKTQFKIDFITPLRLKHNGEYLRGDTPFQVLAGALIRRLETLSFFYCGGSLELDYRALMEKAASIRTQFADLRWVEWERYSRRQGKRIPWAGVVGTMHYEGDFGLFLPFFVLGEIVGVGNNASFGLGGFRVHR